MPTFNLVFEYQLIVSEILTHLSRQKRAEGNSLSDEKGPQDLGQVVAWVINHLVLYFFSFFPHFKYNLGVQRYIIRSMLLLVSKVDTFFSSNKLLMILREGWDIGLFISPVLESFCFLTRKFNDWLVHHVKCPNISINHCNLQNG